MRSQNVTIHRLASLAFLPAGVGLLVQIAHSATLAERLLALALALFSPELARMAFIDLENIAVVAQQLAEQGRAKQKDEPSDLFTKDRPIVEPPNHSFLNHCLLNYRFPVDNSRLSRFFLVTVSTIGLEAIGFYMALISLPGGAIAIVFSQLWFNLLARIQLSPGQTPAITVFGIAERWAVLMANSLGLGLLCLWPIQSVRLWLASGLLTLIVLFLIIKYLIPKSQPS